MISGGEDGFELTAETLLASVRNDGSISGGQNGVVMMLGDARATPELRERLSNSGAEPVGSSPAEFAAFIRAEIERYGKVTREAGIVAD